MTSSENNNKL